jgi:hypothetical protein
MVLTIADVDVAVRRFHRYVLDDHEFALATAPAVDRSNELSGVTCRRLLLESPTTMCPWSSTATPRANLNWPAPLLADGLDETAGALEHLLAVVVGVGHDG